MNLQSALGIARLMLENGISRDAAISNPAIPPEFRDEIKRILEEEDNVILRPAAAITGDTSGGEWLERTDRSDWYYWPRLREYLLGKKGRGSNAVRSLDEATDQILSHLASPLTTKFDVRGLVLGYVQSGKTASYTALVAKAADVGYRLVIVLTGMDKGLRRQTQIRLKRELVGYPDNRPDAVRFPPTGKRWHEFTSDDLDGDFRPGNANQAALQGSQPVLLVVKKNGAVLRRLLSWLDRATNDVKGSLPVLVIDDEADQASVDTRGTYQLEGQPLPTDYEEPSIINGLIRSLLNIFERCGYVAYTATPFANILIPHDTFDDRAKSDLYPKDFIIDLPKAPGYFGAEELFGRLQSDGGYSNGLDVIREVTAADVTLIDQGNVPPSLIEAIETFVLGGAARAERGDGAQPVTMLIHVSRLTVEQGQMASEVRRHYGDLRDEWRYQRSKGVKKRLEDRWDTELRPLIRALHVERDRPFSAIEEHIGPFLEAVEVKVINSDTGEVLDYERQPGLKAIAIGGNRLSRGLTLEGLLASYFTRESETYDTLLQMGRWFGFRGGYEDLTRIYTTPNLEQWFADLAFVESQLREDIKVYEEQGRRPDEFGMRIWQHPALEVTARLKRRFTATQIISMSYSATRPQTFKFPLKNPETLSVLCDRHRSAVRKLVGNLGSPTWVPEGPMWQGVQSATVLEFLTDYHMDDVVTGVSLPLVQQYIRAENENGGLRDWTIAVLGLRKENPLLGVADWALFDRDINLIERTRLKKTDSLGVITSPGDEAVGLTTDELAEMQNKIAKNMEANIAARLSRPASKGLILIYPISRFSGSKLAGKESMNGRGALYRNPRDSEAKDLIAIAISFPESKMTRQSEIYVEGSVGWKVV